MLAAGSQKKQALGAPSAGGQRNAHAQGWAGDATGGGSTFEARMLARRTPPGVYDFAWRSYMGQRVNCTFSHLLAARTAPSVAVQQQQLQAPSRPPPTTLLHQPPQNQAAATAGGWGAGGRGEASRRPSVARFSRNYPAGGQGGASAGGGAGRGNGSNRRCGLWHLAAPIEGRTGASGECAIFEDARRAAGIIHTPTPGFLSPALFHGESPVPRNKNSEPSSRSFETAPRRVPVRQEERMVHAGAQGGSKSQATLTQPEEGGP